MFYSLSCFWFRCQNLDFEIFPFDLSLAAYVLDYIIDILFAQKNFFVNTVAYMW